MTSRYQCQMNLPEISKDGQEKLAKSSILCIGAGGLAHSALLYLSAMGVGHLGVIDGDIVSISNLHRQVLFTPNDVGANKAQAVALVLQRQNPEIQVRSYHQYLTEEIAVSSCQNSDTHLFSQYDVVLDCSDNYFTRYLVNDLSYRYQKPLIFAAVVGFEGTASVFNFKDSPCYRCLYPQPRKVAHTQNCAELGVLGSSAGLMGLLQATEAIKVLLDIGDPLAGKLLNVNLLQMQFKKRTISHRENCELCGKNNEKKILNHFEEHAGFLIPEIAPEELLKRKDYYQVVDVREVEEYERFNIGGHLLPMSYLLEAEPEKVLNSELPTLIVCAHGVRSKRAAAHLKNLGFQNVCSLQGGLAGYQQYLKNV